jgi:anti-sigma-K factor RskA
MEKEKLEAMMVEYVDGTLNDADRKLVEQEIASNTESARLHEQTRELFQVMDRVAASEPSVKLKASFDRILQHEVERQKSSKVISFSLPQVYRMAAGIALVVSVGLAAYWFQERRIEKLAHEIKETKTSMMAMLQNQGSAGQRLKGVSVSLNMKLEQADDEIVNALVHTLETDDNTNVRLASLEALARFHEQPHVRTELVKALSKQTDPSVQIALIRLLVEIKETDSLKELQRISTDELMLPAVQDEAHAGILKLS